MNQRNEKKIRRRYKEALNRSAGGVFQDHLATLLNQRREIRILKTVASISTVLFFIALISTFIGR